MDALAQVGGVLKRLRDELSRIPDSDVVEDVRGADRHPNLSQRASPASLRRRPQPSQIEEAPVRAALPTSRLCRIE